MQSSRRSSSSMAVMGDAFRRSFPLEQDLPPAMHALITRLAALEAKPASAAVAADKIRSTENRPLREPQMA
jgi:hypothetical protein